MLFFSHAVEGRQARGSDGLQAEMCLWHARWKWENSEWMGFHVLPHVNAELYAVYEMTKTAGMMPCPKTNKQNKFLGLLWMHLLMNLYLCVWTWLWPQHEMESNKIASSLSKSESSTLSMKSMASSLDDGEVKKIMEECKRLQTEVQRLREENRQIRVSNVC